MAIVVSWAIVMASPIQDVRHHFNELTRTDMSAMVCKLCGLVKISRRYEAGPWVSAVSALVLYATSLVEVLCHTARL